MTKQEQIEKYLAEPIKAGDYVEVKGLHSNNKEFESMVKVDTVDEDCITIIDNNGQKQKIDKNRIRKSTFFIGADPFPKEKSIGRSYSYDLESVLWQVGWRDLENKGFEMQYENLEGFKVPESCFDPIVTDDEGKDQQYQRGLVWNLEQKQLLIESIYNGIEIGKFVVRMRSWNWVLNRMKSGKINNTGFRCVVDGKQRLNALIEFVTNQYPDLHGNYWNDLSESAQKTFAGFRELAFVELDEYTTDKDVLRTFLAVNFSGIPQSKEHIDHVKSLYDNYNVQKAY